MSEIVKKFKLKRISSIYSSAFTFSKIYDVYHNDTDQYTNLAFYIRDDDGFRQFFNTLDGQLETYRGHLNAKYWEVIRTSKEEKTMSKDFTGLKVGDKITRENDDWSWWIKGKEYTVHANDTGLNTHCDFYIIDEENDRRWFNVDDEGNLTHADLQAHFIWKKPEEPETPILKDGMILVCTKANDEYANFKEGNEYPVQGDHDEPYIKSEGNTPWFGWELEKLAKFGTTFMVKEVEEEPETPPHSITITGHNWVDLEKNLREAYRTVNLLSKASDKFDESTAELAKRVLAFKKIGGQ